MAKSQRVVKLVRRKKSKLTAPKPSPKRKSQYKNTKTPFPHLCRICYALTSRLSEMRPTIPAPYQYGLRFQMRLATSKSRPCSLCNVLFESLLAYKVHFDLEKPVNFILVAPGVEGEMGEDLYDLCALELYWEDDLIKPKHSYPENLCLGKFVVSARSESPAAQHVSNRPPILDVTSPECYNQTRQWLEYCDSHHECSPQSGSHFMPTRVIDVGMADGIPRLYETCGRPDRYVALSYCWGRKKQSVMTNRDNLRDFLMQIPASKLQQSIKDAISITRELGLRFLWIDSLCIVQDSDEDKTKELTIMHKVYSNAYVTIVAASAKDCDEGFLHLRDQLPDNRDTLNIEPFSLPYRLRDGTFDEVNFQPYQGFRPSLEPINSRAWTLQENLLSPRRLTYGSQIVRQCHGTPSVAFGRLRWTATPECGARNALHISELGRAPSRPPALTLEELSVTNVENLNHLQRLQTYWGRVVNDYSKRQVTNADDKLIAISAMARQLSVTAFTNYSYKAGLWLPNSPDKTSFLYDLCWAVNAPLASQQFPYLAPTWSWASGHIQSSSGVRMLGWHPEIYSSEDGQRCEIIECNVNSERGDAFGHVLGGSLTIRGPLRKASILRLNAGNDNSSLRAVIRDNKREDPSELDRLMSFAAMFPNEESNLSRASAIHPTVVYDLEVSASFDEITPELMEDSDSASVWCLQLVRCSGLLLQPVGDQTYRRVGSFRNLDFDSFDGGLDSLFDGCFNAHSLTQVSVV